MKWDWKWVKWGLILAAFIWVYFSVFTDLIVDWINLPDFSHGFLVPLISAYILYTKKEDLASLRPEPHWIGLVILIFASILSILGRIAVEEFTVRVSIIVAISGIVIYLLGMRNFKKITFPILFLLFMIPIPSILMDQITFPMQLIASRISAETLQMMGIPVLREGNVLQLVTTKMEVAEACSGIRSMISLLALAVIFVYFRKYGDIRKYLLIGLVFPIAILANATRVGVTGIIAHEYGESVAQGFFHGFSGWLLFIATFGCLIIFDFVLSKICRLKS
jgi:exosortase